MSIRHHESLLYVLPSYFQGGILTFVSKNSWMCFESRPTELVRPHHEETAVHFLVSSKWAVSLSSSHCYSVPTKNRENINSDLILLGVLILVYYTVSGWVLKRKQLQPSFSCYFWLCRTCPTPVQWGRKPSCHCTPSLHVGEDEKTA